MARRYVLASILMVLVAVFAYEMYSYSRDAPGDGPQKTLPRVPTSGTIRLDGKPLQGAVVTFMPMDSGGTPTRGEAKEDGTYELIFQGFPGGTAPGRYKAYVSYLISPEGETVGMGPRGGMTPDPIIYVSTERLPPKYSDRGRSELIVDVPPTGGTIDFDLTGPLLPLPEPKPGAAPLPAPLPDPTPPPPGGEIGS